jgi:hypothetical protein
VFRKVPVPKGSRADHVHSICGFHAAACSSSQAILTTGTYSRPSPEIMALASAAACSLSTRNQLLKGNAMDYN